MTVRPQNPYAPPREQDAAPPNDDPSKAPFVVASRLRRLAGGLVDCIVYVSVVFAWQLALTSPTSIAWLLFMGPAYFATTSAPLVLQAALIARSGQSVGNRVTRTRIVLANGLPAGLVRGFLVRTLPFVLVVFSPLVLIGTGVVKEEAVTTLDVCVSLVFAVNVLTIFLPGSRFLHDRIAGTHVAVVPSRRRRRKKRRA